MYFFKLASDRKLIEFSVIKHARVLTYDIIDEHGMKRKILKIRTLT